MTNKKAPSYTPSREAFFKRPHFTRRHFFQIAGSGLVASYIPLHPELSKACTVQTSSPVTTQNKAKNVIFILLAGTPSHTDTFDLKVLNGTTPAKFNPAMINGVNWPTGIMPQMGQQLNNMALVRSMQSHALVHSLSQHWTQIG